MSPLDLAHRHRLDVAAKTPAESGEIIDRIHTGDAVDQALEGGVIDLIGAVEIGRVEDGRSGLGHLASPCFPSPLIKPDVRISRIRLSDWLHLAAVGGAPMCSRRSRNTPSFS